MISNAGSRCRGAALAPGLALVFGLGLAALSQPALAGVGEAEPRLSPGTEAGALAGAPLSEEALPAGNSANGTIIVADKNKNKNKYWNKNWNKHTNKNIYITKKNVYVRSWKHKPYYGNFFGGVVLGSILTAAVVGVAPPPPRPDLCWYWSDPYMQRGYWDYCY